MVESTKKKITATKTSSTAKKAPATKKEETFNFVELQLEINYMPEHEKEPYLQNKLASMEELMLKLTEKLEAIEAEYPQDIWDEEVEKEEPTPPSAKPTFPTFSNLMSLPKTEQKMPKSEVDKLNERWEKVHAKIQELSNTKSKLMAI